jgi:hypothetical protein
MTKKTFQAPRLTEEATLAMLTLGRLSGGED